MHSTGMRLAAAAIGLTFSACGFFKKEKPEPPKKDEAPKTALVGRIASVSADQSFVLIQSYGPWHIEAGGILTTRGPEERVGNLRCTGEKLGQFAAADIQAGSPQTGDAVYHTPSPPPQPTPPADPTPDAPAAPASPPAKPEISKT